MVLAHFALLLVVTFVSGAAAASSREYAPSVDPMPPELRKCYLEIAAKKETADAIHAARTVCDDVYRPQARYVVFSESGRCSEWWFDDLGRRVTENFLCSLDYPDGKKLRVACESRESRSRAFITIVDRDTLKPVASSTVGSPPKMFSSLAACIRSRGAR